ncbi:MAG: PKD domain-containing protein [Planctomycetes bacterium]|nr:PKD domain-containing protein [Planctomycetota bacterium]
MQRWLTAIRSFVLPLMLLGAVTALDAQFLAPEQISSASTGCATPAIDRDVNNNLSFAYSCDGDIFFASSVFAPGVDVNVTNGVLAATKPDLFPSFSGQIRIAFQRDSAQPSATGDDILTVANPGGAWGSPINLVLSDDADEDVRIADSAFGAFSFAWWQTSVGLTQEVWLRIGLTGTNQIIGSGSRPSLAYDSSELLHVVFERAGELYHVSHDGTTLSSETPLGAMPGAGMVSIDARAFTHVAYLSGGDLYYTNDESGSFGASTLIDTGSIGQPRLSAGADGQAVIIYEKAGQILMAERTSGTFGAPVTVAASGTEPDVQLDTFGYAHAVYADNGAIQYTNNVPLTTPDFTATPTTGEIFLEVAFTNTSTGVYSSLLWDFGDGSTSTQSNPTHIYEAVGNYTVSLQATGPGGTATEVKSGFVSALPATNTLRVAHVAGFASESIRHPVIITNTVGMQGYQLAVRYDHAITPITDVNLDDSASPSPDFVALSLHPLGAASYLTLGVVLETQLPLTGLTIPPGTGQLLATLDYVIPIGTSVGTTSPVYPENGLGSPPINNIFSAETGTSVLPFLLGGSLTVTSIPTTTFLRGDATGSGAIDIADAVFILSFLFSGGATPSCADAADANDTGAIDVADAIYLLSYLFADGAVPPYPFPDDGLDPTPDSLPVCL